jgi:aminoglycoside 3-N-acetyltransferase
MWTEDSLVEDLTEFGLSEGMHLIVHASMPAIGPIDGGAAALLRAFRRVLGDTGTLLVPTFTPEFYDPAESEDRPDSEDGIERLRAGVGVFDPRTTPASREAAGVFAEEVRRQPDAYRSDHPVASFAAIGALAEPLTAHVPFHYPLGSESPIARLHANKGWTVLIGAGPEDNVALHLAEIWANAPYIHRSARVKTGLNEWTAMLGSMGCTDGFARIGPILRQARIAHSGKVGSAAALRMRIQETVSMAVAMLQGAGDSLLCDDPNCPACHVARRYTAKSTYVEGQPV